MLSCFILLQIYTNDIPLGHVDPAEFTLLVCHENVRPDRPYEDEAPQLTDAVWHLAEDCWAKNPTSRPSANAVCDTVSTFLNDVTRPVSSNMPSPSSPSSPAAMFRTNSVPDSIPSAPRALVRTGASDPPASHMNPNPSPTVVNPPARTPLLCLVGHTGYVPSAIFSPDGMRVASGSRDKTLRIWDAYTGEMLLQPVLHAEDILDISFAPDGNRVATGSRDAIRIWHAGTGRLAAGPFAHRHIFRVIFSPDGAKILFAAGTTVCVINALTGNPIIKPVEHGCNVHSIDMSFDGKRVASGCGDNRIHILNAKTGSVFDRFKGHTDVVFSVAFSPDGKRIVSGSRDRTVIVWDAKGKILAGPIHGHTDEVLCVAFSPDGKNIVSGDGEGDIRVWDATTGALLAPPLEWNIGSIFSVAFSLDGQRIMASGRDMIICLGGWREF